VTDPKLLAILETIVPPVDKVKIELEVKGVYDFPSE